MRGNADKSRMPFACSDGLAQHDVRTRSPAISERALLEVKDLQIHVSSRRGIGKAVDGASFALRRAETLGLVGESGSGKSLTALAILGVHPKPATKIVGGQILFEGENLVEKSSKELREYRGRRIAMILQDPMTALNPVFTIRRQLFEPLRFHERLGGEPLRLRALELLRLLNVPSPERVLDSYPHQLSGGMRQRVVGAIALSCNPELLIADEPTTSLDVTIQAAFLALLQEIQRATKLAILFITHDFSVVAKMCDRVAVMYAGRIVETAPTQTLFNKPAHPYTEALLRSVPVLDTAVNRLPSIKGNPPSIFALSTGCAFAERCPHVMPRCLNEFPHQMALGPSHAVRCWRHE